MSPRTLTAPPDDGSMWRRALARLHPDTGGSHDLFIWAGAVRDVVCGDRFSERSEDSTEPRREASTEEEPARVPFDPFTDLEVLTGRAVTMANAVAEPYAYLLRPLADCYPVSEGPLRVMQAQGATYRTLAAIGHHVGMSKEERVQWYRIAEAVPLSQRHAGHILSKLHKAAA